MWTAESRTPALLNKIVPIYKALHLIYGDSFYTGSPQRLSA